MVRKKEQHLRWLRNSMRPWLTMRRSSNVTWDYPYAMSLALALPGAWARDFWLFCTQYCGPAHRLSWRPYAWKNGYERLTSLLQQKDNSIHKQHMGRASELWQHWQNATGFLYWPLPAAWETIIKPFMRLASMP